MWMGTAQASVGTPPSCSGCGQAEPAWPPPMHGPGPVPPAQHISSSVWWRDKQDLGVGECSKQIKAHLGPTQLLPWDPNWGQRGWASGQLHPGLPTLCLLLLVSLLPAPLARAGFSLPLSSTPPVPLWSSPCQRAQSIAPGWQHPDTLPATSCIGHACPASCNLPHHLPLHSPQRNPASHNGFVKLSPLSLPVETREQTGCYS